MENEQAPSSDVVRLTDWAKEPDIKDLKFDLENARPSHQLQMGKIAHWNNLMKISGASKIKPKPGRSSVQPKLIRRQAEWRYSALSEPFLGSNKIVKSLQLPLKILRQLLRMS